MNFIANWLAFDFETSNSVINIEKEYTRVWLWDIYDPIKCFHKNGKDIESFFDYLFDLKGTTLYAHNLKFDGSFILNYLLRNGFVIDNTKQNMTINTLITDRLVWYSFTIYVNNKKYEFRDSAKKIIGSLEKAAKDFDLPISKGKIDYKKHRDEGYEPTEKEIEYIHTDTEILANILKYYYDNGMTGLTNASDAMKAYKKIVSRTGFNFYFPVIEKETDDFIRKSYKGGFCYLNPIHANNEIRSIYTYDVKSMYPSVMFEFDLPYGIPVHFNGKYIENPYMPLYIQEVVVECKLKNGYTPSIQSKGFLGLKLRYLTETKGQPERLFLTNLDLDKLLNDYEIYEIEYIQGYMFKASNELFKRYVEKYYKLKEASEGALKQLYKIFLNALYGKFAMSMFRIQSIMDIEDNKNVFDRAEPQEVDPIYTPVASFITAYARDKLLKAISANSESFIYCDTDSMHLTSPAKGVTLGEKLGEWNLENGYYNKENKPISKIKRGKYLGQKCYLLCTNKGEIKKIAGATDIVKKQITFDNFKINFTSNVDLYPKFRMKNVDGGVLLIPIAFTINAKL